MQVCARLAAGLPEWRRGPVRHSLETLVRQRVYQIACGYADGFLRALSGPSGKPGPVGYIGEHPVTAVGRVSMDLITVDVTDVPQALAVRRNWCGVLGGRVPLDDLTDPAGTIGYEVLSSLGHRYHRIWKS